MNSLELITYAWQNAFGIFEQTTSDLTQEQANWTPPGVAHSIGTLYWHVISGTDFLVHGWCMGKPPLATTENWRDRVVLGPPGEDEAAHEARMQEVSIDLEAMHAYSKEVDAAVSNWLETLSPGDLEREIETPIGQLNMAQVLEVFAVWHLSAHGGEISALKGCQGARGYPF